MFYQFLWIVYLIKSTMTISLVLCVYFKIFYFFHIPSSWVVKGIWLSCTSPRPLPKLWGLDTLGRNAWLVKAIHFACCSTVCDSNPLFRGAYLVIKIFWRCPWSLPPPKSTGFSLNTLNVSKGLLTKFVPQNRWFIKFSTALYDKGYCVTRCYFNAHSI